MAQRTCHPVRISRSRKRGHQRFESVTATQSSLRNCSIHPLSLFLSKLQPCIYSLLKGSHIFSGSLALGALRIDVAYCEWCYINIQIQNSTMQYYCIES